MENPKIFPSPLVGEGAEGGEGYGGAENSMITPHPPSAPSPTRGEGFFSGWVYNPTYILNPSHARITPSRKF